jgi:hypothetical protein
MLVDMGGLDDGSVSYRPRPIDIDKQLVVLLPGDTPVSIGKRWPSSAGSPVRVPEWLTPVKASGRTKKSPIKKSPLRKSSGGGGSSSSQLIPDDQLGTPAFGKLEEAQAENKFKRGKKYITCETAVRGRHRLNHFIVHCGDYLTLCVVRR